VVCVPSSGWLVCRGRLSCPGWPLLQQQLICCKCEDSTRTEDGAGTGAAPLLSTSRVSSTGQLTGWRCIARQVGVMWADQSWLTVPSGSLPCIHANDCCIDRAVVKCVCRCFALSRRELTTYCFYYTTTLPTYIRHN